MKRALVLPLFVVSAMACGRDTVAAAPQEPDLEPVSDYDQPEEPADREEALMAGIPGLPNIPGRPDRPSSPGFPFPIPGRPTPAPAPAPTPAPEPCRPNPAPTPAPAPGGTDPSGVGAAINRARAARGLSPVVVETRLNCAADKHAKDTGNRRVCTHTGANGSSPWDRIGSCGGPSGSGEIIACGQTSAESAVQAWTGSPGHANIMFDAAQTKMGVAMFQNYWVAVFSKQR